MSETYEIPLVSLLKWNPFSNIVWRGLDCPITKDDITTALKNKTYQHTIIEVPYDESNTKDYHIKRIAYFVEYGWNDAISLDVGVPLLGCYVNWIVVDGNHRLAAAFYKEQANILVDISGDINFAKKLLTFNQE